VKETTMKLESIRHFFPGCSRMFAPMLAAKRRGDMTHDEFLKQLRLPLWETPKIDGMRAITLDMPGDRADWHCLPVSRHMLPLPNKHVRAMLGELCPAGLDGEIVAVDESGDHLPYYASSSQLLSRDGEPAFKYLVFDYITYKNRTHGYLRRIEELQKLTLPPFCEVLEPRRVYDTTELEQLLRQRVDEGFEGCCLRTSVHGYKFGRSTLRQQELVAIKLFIDDDARVCGFEELQRNVGKAEINAYGHQFRRALVANLRPGGTLGTLIGKDVQSGVEVRVGSGFTAAERDAIWDDRDAYVGRVFKYKHQPYGRLDGGKPRLPVFTGWRD
jgi:ATP-dependent DNA ligase